MNINMKLYETFNSSTVEIYAFAIDKPEMLVWRCTEEQGNDWSEIKKRVTGMGYDCFEKRTITEVSELFEINGEKE